MQDQLFQQLLEIELSLSKAQELSGSDENGTQLLQAHVSQLSSHANFLKIQECSSEHDLFTMEEIKDMLASSKPTNLPDSCPTCHQCFYSDDKNAALGKHKADLEKCCLSSIDYKFDELEVTFWWFFIKNFHTCVSILPNYTRLMVNNGVPSNLRTIVWGLLTLSTNSKNRLIDEDISKNLYESLNVDISEDIKIICNDVNRTFPHLSTLRTEKTRAKFENILNAFSVYNFEIGYCQGLQFIVAPLLFHFQQDDEIKTFNSLINMFEINSFLRKMYDDEMTGVNVFLYKFERIFKKHNPSLHAHFKSLNLDLKIFLSQWFLSFFSVTMPFHFSVRMFDVLLFEGVESTLLRVGLTILDKNENLLMQIDNSELIYQHLLSENCWGVFGNNCDKFISNVVNLSPADFTPENLSILESQFEKQDINHSRSPYLPKAKSSFKDKLFSGLGSTFPASPSSSTISSTASTVDSDIDSLHSSSLFSTKNNSTFSLGTESSNTNSNGVEKSVPHVSMQRSTKFQLLKIVDESRPIMKPMTSRKSPSDTEMIKQLYELCLTSGIDDPVLSKVRQRLNIS